MDRAERNELVEKNIGLVHACANKFRGKGAEYDDLFQAGCVGIIKAAENFDPERGFSFSTYAVPKIAGEIRRFLRDDGTVKVSRGIKERALHIKNARCALEQRLGRVPLISELAAETGLTPEDIAFAETAANPAESLQRETGEDGFTLEHVLCDTEGEERMIEHVALRCAIEELPEKERKTLYLRYYHGFTQEKTAKVLGVSQVQISRLERKAIAQLREMLS